MTSASAPEEGKWLTFTCDLEAGEKLTEPACTAVTDILALLLFTPLFVLAYTPPVSLKP